MLEPQDNSYKQTLQQVLMQMVPLCLRQQLQDLLSRNQLQKCLVSCNNEGHVDLTVFYCERVKLPSKPQLLGPKD
ncbi:hypothetical protein pb186bvf_008803 [Paramecium bursaria]